MKTHFKKPLQLIKNKDLKNITGGVNSDQLNPSNEGEVTNKALAPNSSNITTEFFTSGTKPGILDLMKF